MARPMPELPPVTTADFPFRSPKRSATRFSADAINRARRQRHRRSRQQASSRTALKGIGRSGIVTRQRRPMHLLRDHADHLGGVAAGRRALFDDDEPAVRAADSRASPRRAVGASAGRSPRPRRPRRRARPAASSATLDHRERRHDRHVAPAASDRGASQAARPRRRPPTSPFAP